MIKEAYAAVDISQNFGFGNIKSLGEGINLLVAPVFSVATTLVVIYFLVGAFKYLTSGGDKEALASAQNILTHTVIGFVILIFIFLVLQFIPEAFKLNFSIF